jgi:hypothetical protein
MKPKPVLFVLGLLGASLGVTWWTAGVASVQPETCVGDCGGEGQVTVDELLAMVNIALGNANVSTCTAGDVNSDGQTLSETSDMIFDGWQSRSHASDIMAEIDSDTMRGVDRVYDPSNNQVYEVPADWYTNYDAHRGEYSMNDLQLLPHDSFELWTSAPADGSAIH